MKKSATNYPMVKNKLLYLTINIIFWFGCKNSPNAQLVESEKSVIEDRYNIVADTSYNQNFNRTLKSVDAQFSLPKNFMIVCPDTAYFPVREHGRMLFLTAPPNYEIRSIDGKVAISISIFSIKNALQTFNKDKKPFPKSQIKFSTNTNYLRYLSGILDTAENKMTHVYSSDSLRLWGADMAVIGSTTTTYFKTKKYKDTFDKCKVLLMHKDNLADIVLYYWYAEGDEDFLEIVFDNTNTMIRFL